MPDSIKSCDIFCRVIDNFGDAAVCWRLAAQLSREYNWSVRLFIDDSLRLSALAPEPSGVSVISWSDTLDIAELADIVVEAFACHLPEAVVASMVAKASPTIWINLDYLSPEPWVEDCHAVPSIHPSTGLTKYFFFPGFTAKTGGVIREHDYVDRQSGFSSANFCKDYDIPIDSSECLISMFAYDYAPIDALIEGLSTCPTPHRLICPGYPFDSYRKGSLNVQSIPFLPQRRYDELLWLCDFNFVRGEDSFVRAQLAGKPFVWQAYRQADDIHLLKVQAFLARYLPVLKVSAGGTAIITHAWMAWNTGKPFSWQELSTLLPMLCAGATRWREHLLLQPDLATRLVAFCERIANRIE